MKIERFTYRLAFVWLCFRMLADIIGKTINGTLNLIARVFHGLLDAIVHLAILAAVAAVILWLAHVLATL